MDISAAPEFHENLHIPIDLSVSKKNHGLRFTDASGNIVFRVEQKSPKSTHKQVLVDASGNPLVCINRNHSGTWEAFKGDDSKEKDLIFRVERTQNAIGRTEFEVFPAVESGEESKSDFKMKGSPFHRSCTIYQGNFIVAQSSLMYKLGIQKVLVWRHKFRLTIFPRFKDHAFIVALVIVFFDGRKLWI